MTPTLLIVEDDRDFRESLETFLKKQVGFETIAVPNGREAIAIMRQREVDIVLSDIVMPGVDGMGLLEWVVNNRPDTMVIILTAYGDIDGAVEAIKKGAYDYLTKPPDLPRLENTIKRAYEKRQLLFENRLLRRSLDENIFKSIVGVSEAIKEVVEKIKRYAPLDTNVLITGETGTGKDFIARTLHSLSPRADRPFIKVSCAALPESLLESELFGFEKGSFTGANHSKKGRFEMAHGGTILLNEVESLSLPIQAKLLRVIEEKEFERIGGTKTLKADVRIIAASNRELMGLIEEGAFREDLYYRLKVLTIELPPLRERKEDIPLLLHHYLSLYSKTLGKEIKGFTKEAIRSLTEYPWPGNVRELQNLVELLAIEARSQLIDRNDLPPHILVGGLPGGEKLVFEPGTPLAEMEKKAILYTLRLTHGNKKRAAELLGIGLKTLYRKLSKMDLSE